MADSDYEKSAINMEVIKEMAKETTDMVIKSVEDTLSVSVVCAVSICRYTG